VAVEVNVDVGVGVGVRVGTGVAVEVDVSVGMGVEVGWNSWPGPQPEAAKLMTNTRITKIFLFIYSSLRSAHPGCPSN